MAPSGGKRAPRKRKPLAGRRITLQAAAEQLRLARSAVTLPPSPTPYTPPVAQLERVHTSRLLPARYSDSVLTRIAGSDEDLQMVYALDNATNERLLSEANQRFWMPARELVVGLPYARIINAAFAHPHPQGARFSTPYRGAWYAAFELATAKAEVLFHRSVQFAEIGWNGREELDYDHYQADFAGPFYDLRVAPAESVPGRDDARRMACLHPDSYVASQQLAIELLEVHAQGVIYPSVRRSAGTCLACFQPGLVSNVRKRDLHRLVWDPKAPPTFKRVARGEPGLPGAALQAVLPREGS